jgi:hypothetical protein
MCVGIDGKDRCEKIQFECCFYVLIKANQWQNTKA